MATILLSYRDHTTPHGGGAVHGHHVVEQFLRFGHSVITAEPRTDERTRSYPRTWAGMGEMLAHADVIYMRCDARLFDEALLARNRATRRLPVVVELNAPPEEVLARGITPRSRVHLAYRSANYHAILHLADAIVCVSASLADDIADHFAIERGRLIVVPNGGTPATIPAAGSRGSFRAVWAGGSRWPWQALDMVVDAAALLVADEPSARVVVISDAAATRFAGRPGVEARGPVAHGELGRIMQAMDAALVLYRPISGIRAGFYNSPLKLFDAMAAGLPVIGSRLGQIAEVIRDGVDGYLVADDPRQIADRMLSIARDRSLRDRLGASALARLVSAYTWNHTGAALNATIQEVMGARSERVRQR